MIKKLELKEYKSYKDAILHFSTGVNGIIGISQSGKTNILRALKLISTLRPTGINFVRNRNKKKCSVVKIETSEGNEISFEKGKANSGVYTLNKKSFRKLNKTVPEPIAEALNLTDINFYSQFDTPFLIFSKPSEISKTINDATGMSEFETWINKVNDNIRDIKSEKKIIETSLEKNLIKQDAFEDLEDVHDPMNKARKARNKRLKLLKKYEFALEKKNEIERYKNTINEQNRILKHKNQIDIADKHLKISQEIRDEIDKLKNKYKLVDKLIDQMHILEMTIEEHKELVEQYASVLKNAKKCPVCYSKIKESIIKGIIDEISITI